MSRRSLRPFSGKLGKATREGSLLAEVDAKIVEAALKLEEGEMMQAVAILQRAYNQAEAFSRQSSRGAGPPQRPVSGKPRPASAAVAPTASAAAGKLACAMVRLQLAEVHSQLQQPQEALEEMRIAILESDEAWQAALLMSASPGIEFKKDLMPAAALSTLLNKPPAFLERIVEVSVQARCSAAAALPAARAASAENHIENLPELLDMPTDATEGTRPMLSLEEEQQKAGTLLEEATMLARHFLPEEHKARRHAEERLVMWQFSSEQDQSEPASWCLALGGGDAFGAPLHLESNTAAPAPLEPGELLYDSLPSTPGSPSSPGRQLYSSPGSPISPGRQLYSSTSAPDFRDMEETWRDERELYPQVSQRQARRQMPPPRSIPEATPTVSSSSWSGACQPGDVYHSSFWSGIEKRRVLPRQKQQPRRRQHRGPVMPADPLAPPANSRKSVAQPKGPVQPMSAGTAPVDRGTDDPFQDFLQNSNDPTTMFSIKRIALASEDSMTHLHRKMKDESSRFKRCTLKDKSDEHLYEDRMFFSSWGLWATRAGERKMEQWAKMYGWEKKPPEVKHDLFKYYKVKFSGSEPDLGSLRKLLQESLKKNTDAPAKKRKARSFGRDSVCSSMREYWDRPKPAAARG